MWWDSKKDPCNCNPLNYVTYERMIAPAIAIGGRQTVLAQSPTNEPIQRWIGALCPFATHTSSACICNRLHETTSQCVSTPRLLEFYRTTNRQPSPIRTPTNTTCHSPHTLLNITLFWPYSTVTCLSKLHPTCIVCIVEQASTAVLAVNDPRLSGNRLPYLSTYIILSVGIYFHEICLFLYCFYLCLSEIA